MNVLERQFGIMSDLDMGEGRVFTDYRHDQTFPHGGVVYNWNGAGDLKDYTGTAEQWTAMETVKEEINTYNTVIIATYEQAKDVTVRLRTDADGNLYFIAPDGALSSITEDGMVSYDYTELFLGKISGN